jgi:hypothetical protein
VLGKVRPSKNRGFEVRIEQDLSGPSGRAVITLGLVDPRDEEVFVTFVEDIVHHLSGCTSAAAAVSRLADTLAIWQHFFESRSPEGLSERRQMGLYGEIWYMLERLLPTLGPERALSAWTGPGGTNQDFELSAHAIEVKTTSQTPLNEVRISNLRQLDDTVLGGLLLAVIDVERHENATETLVQVVERARTVLSEAGPQFRTLFDERLVMAGYLDVHSPIYGSLGYRVRDALTFLLAPGFPRVVESDLPEGVGDVRYSIARAALMPFNASEQAVAGFLEEMQLVE